MARSDHVVGALLVTLCAPGVYGESQAFDRTLVYPTIPRTTTPDRSATPYVIEGDTVYNAIPGTRTPARAGQSWTIHDGVVRPNIPRTKTPKAP